MITDADRRQFQEHGYVWLSDLEDVLTLQEELKPIKTEVTGQWQPDGIHWRLERVWTPAKKKQRRKGKSACRY